MNKYKYIILFVSVLIILILAFAVWPTLYRYDRVKAGSSEWPVRTNRFTGKSQFFDIKQGGWETVKPTERQPRKEYEYVSLPKEEIKKITGDAGLDLGREYFNGTLYNGSTYVLTEIIIAITANEKNGSIRWDRRYETKLSISPLQTGSFSVRVSQVEDADLSWMIVDIKGFPSIQLIDFSYLLNKKNPPP